LIIRHYLGSSASRVIGIPGIVAGRRLAVGLAVIAIDHFGVIAVVSLRAGRAIGAGSGVIAIDRFSVVAIDRSLAVVSTGFSTRIGPGVRVLVFVLVLLSVFTRAEESPVAEALAPLAVEVTEFVLSTVGSTAPATPDRPSARAKAAVVMMTFFMTSS
jgi:hypothetical protein